MSPRGRYPKATFARRQTAVLFTVDSELLLSRPQTGRRKAQKLLPPAPTQRTDQQVAVIFTKALDKTTFLRFRALLLNYAAEGVSVYSRNLVYGD